MSFLIACPHCNHRPVGEFHYGGPVRPRPQPDAADDEWIDYTYNRPNTRGVELEWWFHGSACRQWFLVRRDTTTNEVLSTDLPGRSAGGADD